jgi:hypothetical protein
VLEPVIARYRGRGLDLYFRADAAFAKPVVYELLDAEGIQYAIRLPGQPNVAASYQLSADAADRPAA